MKKFAVTVFVDAEDAVAAIEAAQDYLASSEALDLNCEAIADDGAVKVRLARSNEGPARE